MMSMLIKIVEGYCSRLTAAQAQRLGRRIGWFLDHGVRFRRDEVQNNIRRCFPEKNEAECSDILERMYANFGQLIVESVRMGTIDLSYFKEQVDVVNMRYTLDAINQGKGVVFLTAHIGNFELLAMMAGVYNVKMSIIVKPIRPPALNEYFCRTRARFGVNMLPPKHSFRDCIAALKRNETVGFILDQNMKRNRGVFVDFFGRPACTSPGLAMMSAQCGSPVVPCFMLRMPDGRHRAVVHPPLPPPADMKPDTIHAATQTYTRIIEEAVRANPDQWIWVHRRWRTQP